MKRIGVSLVALALLSAPASAQQSPDASMAQDLSNCAGAVAAFGGLDVMSFPQGATGPWALTLSEILTALNHEEGLEGMTGRYAASAARAFWIERPRAEQEEAANRCRAHFGSN